MVTNLKSQMATSFGREDQLLSRVRWSDWAFGAALFFLSMTELLDPWDGGRVWVVVLVAATISAAFIVRRIHLRLAIAATFGLLISLDLASWITERDLGQADGATIAGGCVLYACGRWGGWPTIALGGVLAVVAEPLSSTVSRSLPADSIVVQALTAAIVLGIGMTRSIIDNSKISREAAEHQRVRQRERDRLASDVHDAVASRMSAIALRAESARHSSPDELRNVLDEIRDSASAGAIEMRGLVGALYEPLDQARAHRDLGNLGDLTSELEARGFLVSTKVQCPLDWIPSDVSSTAFAIANEACTNIGRHAIDAAEVLIDVSVSGNELSLLIVNDGITDCEPEGNGYGMRSMRGRAERAGGQLSAGPGPTGQWRVAARLPLEGAS